MAKLRFSKRLSVMVDEEMANELDKITRRSDMNRSDIIRAALRSYLQYRDGIKENGHVQET